MNDINQIITLLEQAKQLADKTLEQMKPHTRAYLYFDDVRNGLGLEINRFKKYIKIMEEK
jgi:hypothetical protein